MYWVARCGLDRIASSPDTLSLVTVYVCSEHANAITRGGRGERGGGEGNGGEKGRVQLKGEKCDYHIMKQLPVVVEPLWLVPMPPTGSFWNLVNRCP